MHIFLPNDIDKFLEKVTPEMLDQAFVEEKPHPLVWPRVDIHFPKIKIERKIDLSPVNIFNYEKKNMNCVLQTKFCNSKVFKHMDLEELIADGNAMHQANIENDEEGTVASAAAFWGELKVGALPKKFICNRPFIFIIYDKQSKEILFAGVYRGPTNNNDQ